MGIFGTEDKLILSAFELRFLARRTPTSRYVIDLNENNPVLKKPSDYHTIEFQEDRLFVNQEFVPLFKEHGWTVED